MKEVLKYYKFPLKSIPEYIFQVFTQDNYLAFNWLIPHTGLTENTKKQMLDRINDKELPINPYKDRFYINDKGNVCIGILNKEVEVIEIKSGTLLKSLSEENLKMFEVEKIKDQFREFVLNQLNK